MNRPDDLALTDRAAVRRRLIVRGVVQGVGFRPYVWHLATELHLRGQVRNGPAGVEILVEGSPGQLACFTERLPREAPDLAEIHHIAFEDAPASGAWADFGIVDNAEGPARTMIGHDTAVCADCLAEMFSPADRRWRYAFINCTHCGPRYTLTRHLPYARAQTCMVRFPLCPQCAAEYADPDNRRFHAEPTACPVCGPRLWLAAPNGQELVGVEPVAETLRRLQGGEIVAIKGLGGFHLACNARNADAVGRLRQRKHRDEKPFAVMLANPASAAALVGVDDAERQLLAGAERPIVLLRKRPGCDNALPGVAPGLAWLGVMLPYTPLHYLLFHEAAARPAGTDWLSAAQDLVLVMTSANPGDEPLVTGNDEAVRRLSGIADALLMHDRDIVVRCDDSVVRDLGTAFSRPNPAAASGGGQGGGAGEPAPHHAFQFVRRARGYTPRAIRLPVSGPTVLAVGGYLKNTVCVTREDEAFVSQHIGDLDSPSTCQSFVEVAEHLLSILEVRPTLVVHDQHPDFFSSRQAAAWAGRFGVPALAVQHHHAHIAAIAAEYGITSPLLGLALDGVGLGTDGAAWGGELLQVSGPDCVRLGHLTPLPLPGGDRAAREPWRMAAAALFRMGRGGEVPGRFHDQPLASSVAAWLSGGASPPLTTSLGRWFDAAAGLLGVRSVMAYEGQAAMLLEGLAEGYGTILPLRDGYVLDSAGNLDLLPLLARLADEQDAARGAALFHATLAQALADWVESAANQAMNQGINAATRKSGLAAVVLGGGCGLNHVLTTALRATLAARGIQLLEARQVPPNDGGLSLGQAWVGLQWLQHLPPSP